MELSLLVLGLPVKDQKLKNRGKKVRVERRGFYLHQAMVFEA